jgi:hypothetical protein
VALVETGVQPPLPQTTAATWKLAGPAAAESDAGGDVGACATAIAIAMTVAEHRPLDKTAAASAETRILVVFTGISFKDLRMARQASCPYRSIEVYGE